MTRPSLIALCAVSLTLSLPAAAQDAPAEATPQRSSSEAIAQTESPNRIVEAAPQEEWVAIAPEDLLVMTLAPDQEGNERRVFIQLMPPPFSQGWVENIRTLAHAQWYDGISVNRVQDNYVVQWGDPGHDSPERGEAETKPLPEGLNVMGEEDYTATSLSVLEALLGTNSEAELQSLAEETYEVDGSPAQNRDLVYSLMKDSYARRTSFLLGFPFGFEGESYDSHVWPVHCYGMVGVGRGYSPDTGSGAELYTVIGHAPRHLDRNIALVGRVVEGIEHLSSLPRGTGDLGFYVDPDKRVPIRSIRLASDLPEADPASSSESVGQQTRPVFQYLSTESETFARYAEARANRRDPFFIQPAGGADICNIPVPVRPE